MDRHLYRRKIGETKSGGPVRAYYYWYRDPSTGKQVRKSCGTSKKPVMSKKEAESVIEKLKENDREFLAVRAEAESMTIAKMADSMFCDGSGYLKRRKEDGFIKEGATLKDIRGYLNNFIVKYYGSMKPEEIDPAAVDRDLLGMDRSSSWRNRAVSVLNWILDEAVLLKMIKFKPALKYYRRTAKKKSILSKAELASLFPDDFDALAKIWDRSGEATCEGFMFGAFFALVASTGLRNGEARAVSPSQLILSDGEKIARMAGPDGREIDKPFGDTDKKIVYGLLIDRMYNREDKIVRHLKKGDDEGNKKLRVDIIPRKTVRYLKHWMAIRPPSSSPDLLFTFSGLFNKKPGSERRIRGEYVIKRLEIGLKNAGVDTEGRILKPHSLRYTYNTKMRRKISEDRLRLMMGHDYKGMTDYYTVISLSELEDQFMELHGSSDAVDGFWG